MIQNTVVFIVNGDGSFFKQPPNTKFTANSVNKNSIFVIAPFVNTASIIANFKVAHKSKEDSRVGTLTDMQPREITNESYVFDWNVWEVKVPQPALQFLANNRGSEILVSFTVGETQVSRVIPKYETILNEITDTSFVLPEITVDGRYIVKVASYEYANDKYAFFNDTIIADNDNQRYIVYRAKYSAGPTPSVAFKVDPSIPMENFDEYEPTTVEQLIIQTNENTGEIVNLNTAVGDLQDRATQSENDIELIEADVLELQGKVESHIEDLDNPHAVTAEQVGTYDKATINNKDANTLQEAKDYTYSQVEIDNKDTAIMNKANNLENANMFKDVNYNNVNGVLTFTKYDDTTKQIDLPLELIVTSGYYDEVANELVLVLANGSEIRIPVGDLLTDLDAHNVRFNGSGTNYLVNKNDVESAVKELDTQVKESNDNIALKENLSNKATNFDVVNDKLYPTTRAVYNLFLSQDELDAIYGVRWVEGQSNPIGERFTIKKGIALYGSATGLVYNVGTNDGLDVLNSFDNIPAFRREEVTYGGNTFIRFHKSYYRRWRSTEGGINYENVAISLYKHNGFFAFLDENGEELPYIDISKYEGSTVDNKLVSRSGLLPTVSQTSQTFYTRARNNDGQGVNYNYTHQDLVATSLMNLRWLIRSATRNVQSYLQGVVSLPSSNSDVILYAETESNSVVLSNANASNFVIGQTVSIGSSSWDGNDVLNKRFITSKQEDYPNIGETTITFSGDAVATIPQNSILGSREWISGLTDSIIASDGYYNENNGRYPIKIEGIENPFGNVWKFVAGIKIFEDEVWISTKPNDYNWSSNLTNYNKLNYLVPQSNGYATVFGLDYDYPFVGMTQTVGGSSTTYYADYFYQNYAVGGYRVALVGGGWRVGASAGLFLWNVSGGLTFSYWDIGSRLVSYPL